MMANLQLPLNQDHEAVLGSEYCSGYVDAFGKWNTGFYCPASDESQDVFCCGTKYHKYCCTKKDQVIQAEVQDLTILIGILVGASAAILIITMVSCFCCSCCLLYKKRNPLTSSMYLFQNASEHSGVTNMYSLSNAASRSGTPQLSGVGGESNRHYNRMLLESDSGLNGGGNMSHSHTLPHSLSHHSKANHEQQRRCGTLGRMPRNEKPPAYYDLHHNAISSTANTGYFPSHNEGPQSSRALVGELVQHGLVDDSGEAVAIIGTGGGGGGSTDCLHSISESVNQQQKLEQQMLSSEDQLSHQQQVSESGPPPPQQTHSDDSEQDEQLFHSTKF